MGALQVMGSAALNKFSVDSYLFFAQNIGEIEKIDILQQGQDAFDHFIQTGQVWALLIGIFIGYFFKSMTSY
ncbi:MAG: hypothetical protein AAGG02_19690 [Cyanobacteria bacterium P01_H01_bin.15]